MSRCRSWSSLGACRAIQALCLSALVGASALAAGSSQDDPAPAEAAEPAPAAGVEQVVVEGRRGGDPAAPTGLTSSVIHPDEAAGQPATLTELASQVAGVSENGQGGIFQTVSIRGIARHRVLTLVDGVRVTGERRAGVSTSFVDPLLIGSVDVLRGPASSYYGSGALGGVLQVYTRELQGWSLAGGYDSTGDGAVQSVGYGAKGWSAAVAHRRSGDAETPGGERLFSRYDQWSAALSGSWGQGPRRYRVAYLPSRGEDIGKASSDFPGRTTIYPSESHDLLRYSVEGDGGWGASAYLQPHDLETLVTRTGGSSTVRNDSLDYGARWWGRTEAGRGLQVRYGADLYGRTRVDAEEVAVLTDPNGVVSIVASQPLDGARESEAGLFASLAGTWGRAAWEVGGRFTRLEQDNGGAADVSRSAGNGYAGLMVPLTPRLQLRGHAGSGLRFPALSERYFSGTTGRGSVTANPGLRPERSLNTELGLRWIGSDLLVGGSLFHNRIERYIERIKIAPDELTFVNLTSGTLTGAEVEGMWHPGERWSVHWGGHRIVGRDQDDSPLADVPPDTLWAGADRRWQRWEAGVRLEWRDALSRPGSGEQSISSARLLTARVTLHLAEGWRLRLSGSNLLDESHFLSADEKATRAEERAFGVLLSWSGG